MYEELAKELREPCPHENCVLCQKAADAIEELGAIIGMLKDTAKMFASEAPRWIPVTERLPEDMCNVLVTDGKNAGMGWLDYYTRKDTGAVERDWFAPNTPVKENKITHWMPLPEPPTEETE